MTVKEAYLVLGLKDAATLEEVRRAYKEEVAAWHPDRFTAGTKMHGRAQEKLKRLNEARSVLIEHFSERVSGTDTSGKTQQRPQNQWPLPHLWSCVTYLGKDPRLDNSSISLLNRRSASVIVTENSILLVFAENNRIEYCQPSLIDLTFSGGHWSTPNAPCNIRDYPEFLPQMGSCDVSFRTLDPEGILPSITVQLRFGNEYWAQTFRKRVISLFFSRDVVRWMKIKRAEQQENNRREREEKLREVKLREAERRKKQTHEVQENLFLESFFMLATALGICAVVLITTSIFRVRSADQVRSHNNIEPAESPNVNIHGSNNLPHESGREKHHYPTMLSTDWISTGTEYHRQQRYLEAILAFRAALSENPASISAANNLVWILATCPDSSLRHGQEAVKLSHEIQSYALNNRFPWNACCTIAAAYAEIGRFDIAVEWQRKSFANAPQKWKQSQEDRLKQYERNQPFRESSPQIVTISH